MVRAKDLGGPRKDRIFWPDRTHCGLLAAVVGSPKTCTRLHQETFLHGMGKGLVHELPPLTELWTVS